jgi:hypothetical protein
MISALMMVSGSVRPCSVGPEPIEVVLPDSVSAALLALFSD